MVSTTSCPARPTRPTGEERAWARRLAKRFGAEARLDDRSFVVAGDGSVAGGLDFVAPKAKLPDGVEELFSRCECSSGATASWRSAGLWPKTWPGASSVVDARQACPGQPRGRTAVQTL